MGLPCRPILVIRAEDGSRGADKRMAACSCRTGVAKRRLAPLAVGLALAAAAMILGQAWRAAAQVEPGIGPERLAEVVPEATRVGEPEGEPASAPAYRDGELIGYVFHTREVVQSVGYSGKPLDVLVGLGLDGRITGAEILEQHEPILVIGVSPEDLERFVDQYRGVDVREPVEVVRMAPGAGEVDAVSGATISSAVINDAIIRAARAVARARGLFGETLIDLSGFEPLSWQTLLEEGSLARLRAERRRGAGGARAAGRAAVSGGCRPRAGRHSRRALFRPRDARAHRPQPLGRSAVRRGHGRSRRRRPADLRGRARPVFIQGHGVAPPGYVRSHPDRPGRPHLPAYRGAAPSSRRAGARGRA